MTLSHTTYGASRGRLVPIVQFHLILLIVLLAQPVLPRVSGDTRPAHATFRPALPSDAEEKRRVAERYLTEAKELCSQWSAAGFAQALAKYQDALVSYQEITDRQSQIKVLLEIGQIQEYTAQVNQALAAYRRALALSRELGQQEAEAAALRRVASLYIERGNVSKALPLITRALELSEAQHNPDPEAVFQLGQISYYRGDPDTAQKYLKRALDTWLQLNQKKGQAQALSMLGHVAIDLGNTSDALQGFGHALLMWDEVGDLRGKAQTLNAIALTHSLLGDKQKASEFHHQALEIFQRVGDPHQVAITLNGLGYIYYTVGEYKQSLALYNQALQLFRAGGDREGESIALARIGKNSEMLWDNKHAEEYYIMLLRLTRSLGDRVFEAYALNWLGDLYVTSDRQKALIYYNQSLVLSRRARNPRNESYTLNRLAHVYSLIGHEQRASTFYRKALRSARLIGDREGESLTIYNLAILKNGQRDLDQARVLAEESIAIIESLRTTAGVAELRASYFATVHQQYELYCHILMQLAQLRPDEHLDIKAFETSEKARARSLLDSLKEAGAEARLGLDPTLAERERKLGKDLDSKSEQRAQLLAGKRNEEADAVAREIGRLSVDFDQVRAQIRSQNPRYAALTQSQPLGLPEIQSRLLDDNTALLEYMLGDERSYVWVVTRAGVSSHELPGRAEIEKTARRYHELVIAKQPLPEETPEQTRARAEEAEKEIAGETASLSKLLLAPVANELGTKRLLIVADGALQYTPFQSLTVLAGARGNDSVASTQPGEQRLLVLDHEIIYEPSASTLALVLSESADREPPIGSVAVVADPVFDAADTRIKSPNPDSMQAAVPAPPTGEVARALRDVGIEGGDIPRLLSSRDEAEAIMSLVPWGTGFKAVDFDASRTTAMGANLGQYRVVHFATHALLNDEHPELSGILLSRVDAKGQQQDGFLRLHDIYNLKLPVDLVVLSACQTGLGKDVKGEGLIGLTRGFMYAGASGVVASLWKVDDEATAELMKYFYQGMFESGLSPAAALREAQLALRKQTRWQEPYYWAGFVIQGQYSSQIHRGYQPTPAMKLVAVSSTGVLLSLSLLLVLWRRRRRNL